VFVIGRYPDIGLAAARAALSEARASVAQGVHPKDARDAAKLEAAEALRAETERLKTTFSIGLTQNISLI
jgi:hypothetical protein